MLGLGLELTPTCLPLILSTNLDIDTLAIASRMAAAGSAQTADHRAHIGSLIVGLSFEGLRSDFDGGSRSRSFTSR